MSDSLWPHGLQHARPPCPSPTPRVYSNSCSLSWWCHPAVSSSVALFSCPQSFPASGSFPMSWLFASGDQSIRASASVLPVNIQGWFPLGLTGLISLPYKGLSRVFSSTAVWKHQLFSTQPCLWYNSHIHSWLWKYQTILHISWETCMQVKKQQLEPCMQQLTGSGLRKEYDKAVYCPPGGTSITQPRIDAFKLRCWRRLLRVPWTAMKSNWSNLKEINS